ncbi:hypothetical protein [Streptomyces sp. NPDC048445]|uniref:hypothetical protein n=1 Tax=Streptomyces sp. NPDC048445 TaxID=3365553 RepID=UPI0037154C98
MADNTSIAQQLLAALHNLDMADLAANPTGQPVARISIRTMGGEFVGELQLGQRAAEETTNAASAVAEYALAMPADYQAGRTAPTANSELHPMAAAELIDMFDSLDLVTLTKTVLNAAAPTDRLAATKAIDDVFGHIPHPGVEDGDL